MNRLPQRTFPRVSERPTTSGIFPLVQNSNSRGRYRLDGDNERQPLGNPEWRRTKRKGLTREISPGLSSPPYDPSLLSATSSFQRMIHATQIRHPHLLQNWYISFNSRITLQGLTRQAPDVVSFQTSSHGIHEVVESQLLGIAQCPT